jgi:hypothetical protein
MREKQSVPPTTHSRKTSEINADSVLVQFSPEVVRGFARLEAALHDSQHFSQDILLNLQDYAAGKPLSVERALTGIALVTRETMEHVRATGDERTKDVLNNFISDLLGVHDNSKPVALLHVPVRRR